MFWTCLLSELHQFVRIFTDEPLLVVTSNVMPDDSVAVEVVQNCDACLVVLPLHFELSVVRLRLLCTPS